ncbi:uncharacterized protein EI90DRAFT_3019944 [Cantharellus anzutake]|uniref:uncharacterized protein n=1 Tax=Cantharellus anzutake TaxID=1750568 RepID=UPI001906B935|nr:uncharacterized protein EI90DRAFT_3019944 [Cantharellus anzutake]KAF8322952.1 hypothetical protein EI90DRAFT_3019944 [Cantharellus anzutake]
MAINRSTKKEKITIPDFILFWIEGVHPQQFIATVLSEGLEEHMRDDFLAAVPVHLRQIIIQVFVAFHTYPQQEIIHHTLIIGAFYINIWSNNNGPAQLGSEAVTSFTSEPECSIKLNAGQAIVKGEDLLDQFYPYDDSSDEMVVSEDSKDSKAADPSYVPGEGVPFDAVMNLAGQD